MGVPPMLPAPALNDFWATRPKTLQLLLIVVALAVGDGCFPTTSQPRISPPRSYESSPSPPIGSSWVCLEKMKVASSSSSAARRAPMATIAGAHTSMTWRRSIQRRERKLLLHKCRGSFPQRLRWEERANVLKMTHPFRRTTRILMIWKPWCMSNIVKSHSKSTSLNISFWLKWSANAENSLFLNSTNFMSTDLHIPHTLASIVSSSKAFLATDCRGYFQAWRCSSPAFVAHFFNSASAVSGTTVGPSI